MTKKILDIEEFDFGFTFGDEGISEEELSSRDAEIAKLKKQVTDLHKAIIPFLDNLAKDPEKPIIWPNRDKKIKEFKEKLKKIVEG